MLDVYLQMTPDAFRLQLQTVLTTYYEDIKGAVSASGCTKPKVVERRFEDQDDAADAADGDADAAAAAAAAANATATTPATQLDGGAAPAPGGEEPPQAPSPGGKSGGGKGERGAGGSKKAGKP